MSWRGGDMDPSKYTHNDGGLGELAASAASTHPQCVRSSAQGGGELRGDCQPVPLGGFGLNHGSIGEGWGGSDEVWGGVGFRSNVLGLPQSRSIPNGNLKYAESRPSGN